MGLVELFLAAWVVMHFGRVVKEEYQHSRDIHATRLTREHSDWSPGRIRRNARRRARGDWLDEISGGFPTLRRMLAEDRMLAKTERAEAEAEGAVRIRDLRERLSKAVARREAARRAPDAKPGKRVTAPEPGDAPEEPGTGTRVPDAKPGEPVKAEPGSAETPEPDDGPVSSVTHHDHTYMLPGECPECGGPGPGIPLVRGDRVKVMGVTDGGTPEGATVVSTDGETATAELPDGRRVTAPIVPGEAKTPADDKPEPGSRDDDPPSLDGPMPPLLMTKGELDHYRQTGDFVAGAGRDDSAGWPEDNWPDGDAVPDPPNDETADGTTEKEGDGEMTTDIESAETPYQGMQTAFKSYAESAAKIAKDAGDDLGAQAAIHGFDRDGATMADIQALQDAADALVARANAAHAGLIGRHADGEEYHGTGQDAHATAFRPA